MGSRFELQLKSANEQLLAQSERLETMLKDVCHSVETRLANGSFSTWVPIKLEKRAFESSLCFCL